MASLLAAKQNCEAAAPATESLAITITKSS